MGKGRVEPQPLPGPVEGYGGPLELAGRQVGSLLPYHAPIHHGLLFLQSTHLSPEAPPCPPAALPAPGLWTGTAPPLVPCPPTHPPAHLHCHHEVPRRAPQVALAQQAQHTAGLHPHRNHHAGGPRPASQPLALAPPAGQGMGEPPAAAGRAALQQPQAAEALLGGVATTADLHLPLPGAHGAPVATAATAAASAAADAALRLPPTALAGGADAQDLGGQHPHSPKHRLSQPNGQGGAHIGARLGGCTPQLPAPPGPPGSVILRAQQVIGKNRKCPGHLLQQQQQQPMAPNHVGTGVGAVHKLHHAPSDSCARQSCLMPGTAVLELHTAAARNLSSAPAGLAGRDLPTSRTWKWAAASGAALMSGWRCRARRRYARLISALSAVAGTPKVS